MATMDEAKAVLLAHHFGFVEAEGGALVRTRAGKERTRFVPVEGGFEHYFNGEKQPHSLLPAGHPVWDGLPPGVRNGLDAAQFPRFFEWVWPPGEIVKVYGAQPEE